LSIPDGYALNYPNTFSFFGYITNPNGNQESDVGNLYYNFVQPDTLTGSIAAALPNINSDFICSLQADPGSGGSLSQIGVTEKVSDDSEWYLDGNAKNVYGLPILAIRGIGMAPFYSGPTYAFDQYGLGDPIFVQTAQPTFTHHEYDFWTKIYLYVDASGNPQPLQHLPGEVGFSSANQSGVLVTSVGGGTFNVFGYHKLNVSNGYPGVYGYLGQYFSQAYTMDDSGNVTTTTSGILSPKGDFVATQPGDMALETEPDLNVSGEAINYGAGAPTVPAATVHVISLAVDANHDGTVDTTLYGPDTTSANAPYVFWCNNNYDRWTLDVASSTLNWTVKGSWSDVQVENI
jgi:hypothetical protein